MSFEKVEVEIKVKSYTYPCGNFVMGQNGPRPNISKPWVDYLAWAKHRMQRHNESEPGLSARLDCRAWPGLGTGLLSNRGHFILKQVFSWVLS